MKTMTIPKQHDWILPVLALLMFISGGVFFKLDQRLPETVWEGRDLIAGLDPKELTKISFKTASKSFSVIRQGDTFIIDSQNSSPADPNKLNEVMLRLGGAQITEVVGGKSDWEKFNVSDKNSELTIQLFTRDENAKWIIHLGKNVPGKPGRAARLDGKDEVFATNDFLYIPNSDTDFVAKEAFKINKGQITGVELIQDGHKLDENKFVKDELLSSLEPLKVKSHFRTGSLPADLQGIAWNWQVGLINESGLIYIISLAKKDDRWFAKAQAQTNQSIADNGPIIDIKLLSLKSEADRFNQQKMPWIWNSHRRVLIK